MNIRHNKGIDCISTHSKYNFANEPISEYIRKLSPRKKSVLTVAASGDHILNAVSLGAEDVVAFDSNQEALLFSEIKIVACSILSHDQFFHYFTERNDRDKFMNLIAHKLTKKCLDYLRNKRPSLHPDNYEDIHKNNLYTSKSGYKKLQDRLKNVNVEFLHSNIVDLPELLGNRQFDYGMTSNISDYVGSLGLEKKGLHRPHAPKSEQEVEGGYLSHVITSLMNNVGVMQAVLNLWGAHPYAPDRSYPKEETRKFIHDMGFPSRIINLGKSKSVVTMER